MLPYLHQDTPFPPTIAALDEPNGLLAAGGDLKPTRLIEAYSRGIFPWYSDGEPILWWSPDPRTVFMLEHFKPSRSLRKLINKDAYRLTLNQAFAAVMSECAQPRSQDSGTWITDEMIQAYVELHRLGYAHSVEVWRDDHLVGGIYGVAMGQVFCGESMFSRVSNASKLALTALVKHIQAANFKLLDCQVENAHLSGLGAIDIKRDLYLDILREGLDKRERMKSRVPLGVKCQSLWATRMLDLSQLLAE